MEKQDSRFPDDLLSAYVDGELSPEDHAIVEEAVANSLPLQRTVEDLKKLKGKLSELPRFELENGFNERICESLAYGKRSEAPANRLPIYKTNRSRPVLWSAAIVVAAMLVVVCLPSFEIPFIFRKNEDRLADRSLPQSQGSVEQLDEQKALTQPRRDGVADNQVLVRPNTDDLEEPILSQAIPSEAGSDRISAASYLAELAGNIQSSSFRYVAMVDANQSIDIEGELSTFFIQREKNESFTSKVNEQEIRYIGINTTRSELEEFNKKWESKLQFSITEASEVLQVTSQPNVRYHLWKRFSSDASARHETEPSGNDLLIDLEDSDRKSHDGSLPRNRQYSVIGEGLRDSDFLSVAGDDEPIRVLFSITPGFVSSSKPRSEVNADR